MNEPRISVFEDHKSPGKVYEMRVPADWERQETNPYAGMALWLIRMCLKNADPNEVFVFLQEVKARAFATELFKSAKGGASSHEREEG